MQQNPIWILLLDELHNSTPACPACLFFAGVMTQAACKVCVCSEAMLYKADGGQPIRLLFHGAEFHGASVQHSSHWLQGLLFCMFLYALAGVGPQLGRHFGSAQQCHGENLCYTQRNSAGKMLGTVMLRLQTASIA